MNAHRTGDASGEAVAAAYRTGLGDAEGPWTRGCRTGVGEAGAARGRAFRTRVGEAGAAAPRGFRTAAREADAPDAHSSRAGTDAVGGASDAARRHPACEP
ncbi:hypothetical protein [Streptomyces hawaiiensis]|uniref:Uncharacterized protein n=1 Tax=Streptomyces hawaiiensis TaxID=67305 RepID=A0A6G5RA83_9ACTN|nr:hypothetical protein [Streptomyces hawaiiensis]QCD54676.1 hypothetical protein CEB94_07315 [Streptomyces hawaiiensis]